MTELDDGWIGPPDRKQGEADDRSTAEGLASQVVHSIRMELFVDPRDSTFELIGDVVTRAAYKIIDLLKDPENQHLIGNLPTGEEATTEGGV